MTGLASFNDDHVCKILRTEQCRCLHYSVRVSCRVTANCIHKFINHKRGGLMDTAWVHS